MKDRPGGLPAHLQGTVPGFESPACPCGWHQETARHTVLDCPQIPQRAEAITTGSCHYRLSTADLQPPGPPPP